jgi:hypothetical protein
MAELEQRKPVSLEELMVSTLAMTDALAKLLIEKGVITDAEFKQKLLEERAVYQRYSESNNAMIISSYQEAVIISLIKTRDEHDRRTIKET